MHYYDEELQKLQQQISLKNQIETELDDLYRQQDELRAKVRELEKSKWREEADVERLEGRSLSAIFYRMTGKMDEMLDKEKAEAYAAAVKYDAAAAELAAVEQDIEYRQRRLAKVRGSEERYAELLKKKKEAVKGSGRPEAAEILRLEEKMLALEYQKREIAEAVSAGYSALHIAEQILASLDSADGWATWDMLGGGMVTDMMKHSHLDDAQNQIEELQVALRRFKTELADVTIYADLQVSVEGFLRFADYFFDGLFVDWAVKDKIGQSRYQIQDTRSQISNVLGRLELMQSESEMEMNRIKQELDVLVYEASV